MGEGRGSGSTVNRHLLHKHEDDWSLESLVDTGECGGPHATPASEEDPQNKLTKEAESLMSFLAVIKILYQRGTW